MGCLIKDSSSYLEHVNGRRHNRNLGMNMKVEKIGVERVREKLKAMRKEPEAIEPEDIAARIQALEEEQEAKKRKKKEKKRKKNRGTAEGEEEDGDLPPAKKPRDPACEPGPAGEADQEMAEDESGVEEET